MITLTNQDKVKLEKALARADGLTLRATDVDGVYFVYSGKNIYMIVIAKQDGQVKSDCTCPAGMHDRICKHQALALAAFKAKLEAKKHLCASCGIMPVVELDGTCQLCTQEDAQDLEEFLFTEELQPRYRRSA